MVGFKDGIMRTLLLHPDRLISRQSLIDIRVHSALTIHSEDSANADVIDLLAVSQYVDSLFCLVVKIWS